MRVLCVSHMFPSTVHPNHGLFIYRHIQGLIGAGVEVQVLQPVPWAPPLGRGPQRWQHYRKIAREVAFEGLPVKRVPYLQPPSAQLNVVGSATLTPALIRALVAHRKGWDFDVIHAHTLSPDGFAAVLAGQVLGKPVVVSARGSDVHTYPHRNRLAMAMARFTLSRCDRLVCVSEALAKEAQSLAQGPLNAQVIYNGVNGTLFSPCLDKASPRRSLALAPDATILLCVGSLIAEKGVLDLMAAFAALYDEFPHVTLVFLGEGPLMATLRTHQQQLAHPERLHLPGNVPAHEVSAYLQAADLLVHPSHAEGLPNAVLEGMAAGLPVVATDAGGIPEVIRREQTGLLVPVGDRTRLTQALRHLLLQQPAARERMGAAGRALVLETHTWTANANAYCRVYGSLLGR